MHFYNITFDIEDDNKMLYPYIPGTAGDNEDKTTPRVCLCDSVAHCMQAIAPIKITVNYVYYAKNGKLGGKDEDKYF